MEKSFNPRARMGRDRLRLLFSRSTANVSIHAPAWGATNLHYEVFNFIFVSIHAPAWGATLNDWKKTERLCSFNPRARMGRDIEIKTENDVQKPFQSTRPHGARPKRPRISLMRFMVSIHAPAWGATMYSPP